MTDHIKKAFESAEQEIQDKEVSRLKGIIKNLLQKKKDKEDEKRELDEEISTIKNDIEDFKKGRLDKIKERHDKDPKADKASPINITIINDNSRTVYPSQPWRWNYEIAWNQYPFNNNIAYCGIGNTTMTTAGNNALYLTSTAGTTNMTNCAYTAVSGSTAANFTSGTYEINGKIINL